MAGTPALETNVQALEKELIIYEKGIPELLELDTPFYSLLEKTESDPASNRATRIPLLVAAGGQSRQANMDNADLGGTSGPNWIVATLTPNYYVHGVSISKLAEYAGTGADRAVKNPLQETIRVTLKQFRSWLDMLSNTGGNGVMGTITTVAANTFTMTTDGFKVELFYVGMPVQIYDTTLTTNRGGSTVTAIDRTAFTITVAAAPGGTVITDKVVIDGLSGVLTIQSSLFGLQYHQSDATSGLWMNVNRATFPNVRTPSVNAASSGLTTAPIRRALNLIRENVGDDAVSTGAAKLIAYMHPAQADAYESLATTISAIFKNPTGNDGVDLLFNNKDGMTMSNVAIKQSIHADRTRIDFLPLSYWGRIVATDTGFYKVGDQYLFATYNATADGLKSSQFFYYKVGLQIYTRDPIMGAYIKNLTPPANY